MKLNEHELLSTKLLAIRLELEEILCRKEAMIAANQLSKDMDVAQAYDDDSFYDLGNEIQDLIENMEEEK